MKWMAQTPVPIHAETRRIRFLQNIANYSRRSRRASERLALVGYFFSPEPASAVATPSEINNPPET